MNPPTYHAYAKASMLSLILPWLITHQPELTVICTLIGGLAGLVSLIKGIRGK